MRTETVESRPLRAAEPHNIQYMTSKQTTQQQNWIYTVYMNLLQLGTEMDIMLRMNSKHIPDLVHEYTLMGWRNTDQPRKRCTDQHPWRQDKHEVAYTLLLLLLLTVTYLLKTNSSEISPLSVCKYMSCMSDKHRLCFTRLVPAEMSPQTMTLSHITTNTCTYTCTNVRFMLQVSE